MRNALVPPLVLVVLLLVSPLVPLNAHAILLSAAPAPDDIVYGGAVHIELRFNARIDARRSRLILVLPAGRELSLSTDQPVPDTLTSVASDLAPGSYILRWQVLAVDGHITRGEVPFRAR
jgi:methionine-rich copper-binding protein CopC